MGIKINFATGFEIPPFWLKNKEIIGDIDKSSIFPVFQYVKGMEDGDNLRQQAFGKFHFDHVRLKLETEPDLDEYWYPLPLDPVISITGKNTIVRRSVLKTDEYTVRRGAVKELWSQDDYEINIAGIIIGHDDLLPKNNLRILKNMCEARQAINIKSGLLSVFGIDRIVVEDFSFPFTKGMENQMYTIKAYSDDNFGLLVENSL
jgi:hypothetical protein